MGVPEGEEREEEGNRKLSLFIHLGNSHQTNNQQELPKPKERDGPTNPGN